MENKTEYLSLLNSQYVITDHYVLSVMLLQMQVKLDNYDL